MVKQHLKRLASPKTWDIVKKSITFITRPNPGPHPVGLQMPINVILRDLMNVVKSTKEAKYVIHNKDCLIDGKNCHDYRQPAGLMDVISVPSREENYRVLINKKNKLYLVKLSEKEAKIKLVKIQNKTTIKGGKLQLNCTDGRNIIVSGSEKYVVGDSLIIELPKQKVTEHFVYEVGAQILLTSGKHVGELGTIEELKDSHVVVKTEEKVFTTKRDFAFVIGKTKPAISL